MRQYDIKSEASLLATLATSDPEVTSKMKARILRKLKHHYLSPAHLEIYIAMRDALKLDGEIPSFTLLGRDPGMTTEAKSAMVACKLVKPMRNQDIGKAVDNIRKHYEARVMFDLHTRAGEEIKRKQGPRKDVWIALHAEAIKQLTACDDTNDARDIKTVKKDLLRRADSKEEASISRLKTGWPTFDRHTKGGIDRKSLVIMSATSGSGKSTVAMTLARNMVYTDQSIGRQARILIISYELGKEELDENLISCISGVPIDRIKSNKLTDKERNWIKSSVKRTYKDGGGISVVTPSTPRTLQDIWDLTGGKTYDMIVIDYAGLVARDTTTKKNEEREDQHFTKMAAACKLKAKELNCVVLLLAQLNDSNNNVMYSSGFRHNADMLLKWKVDKDCKDRGFFEVEIDKARRAQSNFPFYLSTEFDTQQCNDCTEYAVKTLGIDTTSWYTEPKAKLLIDD